MKSKRCKICGEMFTPSVPAQIYCNKTHYNKCPICGQQIIWNSQKEVKPCSRKCSALARQRTLEMRYDVDNAVKLRKYETKVNYNTLKLMQTMDQKYADKLKDIGFNIWDESVMQTRHIKMIVDEDVKGSIYIVRGKRAKQFFLNYGMSKTENRYKGITIARVVDDEIVDAIKIQLSRIRHYECELTDYGTSSDRWNLRSFRELFEYVDNMYEIESFAATLDTTYVVDPLMKELKFKFQFDRPRLAYWEDDTLCTNRQDMKKKLAEGHVLHLGELRKFYTFESSKRRQDSMLSS